MNAEVAEFYVTRKEVVRALRKQLDYLLETDPLAVMVCDPQYLMPRMVPPERFEAHVAKDEVLGVLNARATDEDISAMIFGEAS